MKRLSENQIEWLVGFLILVTTPAFAALIPVLSYLDLIP